MAMSFISRNLNLMAFITAQNSWLKYMAAQKKLSEEN
jgi:hypothetical protein